MINKTILFRMLWLPILFCSHFVSAQENYRGKIVDENANGLPLVNVFLLSKADSTVVTASVTDSIGQYKLAAAKKDYMVKCSYIGYETCYIPVPQDGRYTLSDIHMAPSSQHLGEIEVTGRRQTFKIEENALVADVENNKILKSQTNVYDVLGKIPGIIQTNQSISVVGKGAPVYYINGRKVFDEADIQNLSVDQIVHVKVVRTKDVQYDAGSNAVIDIKTKRLGQGLAFNVLGNAQMATHLSSKYGLHLSYTHGNWDYFLNYSYNKTKSRSTAKSDLKIYSDTIWTKITEQVTDDYQDHHHYQTGLAYHFSPDSQWGLQYTGNYQTPHSDIRDSLSMTPDNNTPLLLHTQTNNDDQERTHHVNSYYKTKFGDNWDLGICGDYLHKSTNHHSYLHEQDNANNSYEIRFKQSSDWDVLAMNIYSTHRYESGQAMTFGYDFSYTSGTESIDYDTSTLRGDTENKETKHSLYMKYNLPLGMFSLDMGLRYEAIHSDIHNKVSSIKNSFQRHYVLPSVSLNYSKGMLMQNLSYSMDLQHPNFSSLNANLAYTNRYAASIGNLGLKTETNHNINYMLMYKYLYFNLGYTYTHRPILGNYYAEDNNSSVIVGQVANFGDSQDLNAMLDIRPTIKQFTPSLTLICMKSFLKHSGLNGRSLYDKNPLLMSTVGLDVSLPKDYIISAKYYHNWGGDLQMMTVDQESSLDMSINKSFLNNRLTVSMGVSDIFDDSHSKGSWTMNNFRQHFQSKDETRKFNISIIYRFRDKKNMAKHNAVHQESSRLNLSE